MGDDCRKRGPGRPRAKVRTDGDKYRVRRLKAGLTQGHLLEDMQREELGKNITVPKISQAESGEVVPEVIAALDAYWARHGYPPEVEVLPSGTYSSHGPVAPGQGEAIDVSPTTPAPPSPQTPPEPVRELQNVDPTSEQAAQASAWASGPAAGSCPPAVDEHALPQPDEFKRTGRTGIAAPSLPPQPEAIPRKDERREEHGLRQPRPGRKAHRTPPPKPAEPGRGRPTAPRSRHWVLTPRSLVFVAGGIVILGLVLALRTGGNPLVGDLDARLGELAGIGKEDNASLRRRLLSVLYDRVECTKDGSDANRDSGSDLCRHRASIRTRTEALVQFIREERKHGRKPDLAAVDLNGADLHGMDLEGAIFADATFVSAELGRANLRGVDFEGADLTGASLSEADLTGALFGGIVVTMRQLNPGEHLAPPKPDSGVVVTFLSMEEAGRQEAAVRNSAPEALRHKRHCRHLEGAPYNTYCGAVLNWANLRGVRGLYVPWLMGSLLEHTDLTGAELIAPEDDHAVRWLSTTCPDGLNSDNVGGTCKNHLVRR